MLSKSIFLARPLENNLTFWFFSLTAHNLCCLLGYVDEWRRVSQNRTSLLDALFCLEPYSNIIPSTIVSRSHDHPLTHMRRQFKKVKLMSASVKEIKLKGCLVSGLVARNAQELLFAATTNRGQNYSATGGLHYTITASSGLE